MHTNHFAGLLFLYAILVLAVGATGAHFVAEQRRHHRRLFTIEHRVLVNGIRGKSSVTRLCAGALRASGQTVVAKTTGTAARFIYPSGREMEIARRNNMANVIEQVIVVRRASACRPWALVAECMAVLPELQQLNTEKLLRPTVVVITNVREDHLDEMGPTLDDVARSLARSMPAGGVCITAEADRLHILQEEADARGCELIYAEPRMVSDADMAGFSWITFKDNVACALKLAEILGVPRELALEGMYAAAPDPGVLRVDSCWHNGKNFSAVNLFAANDPASTMMNIKLLTDRGLIGDGFSLVINCRPDRVERNGQMGEMVARLAPERVYLIGDPTRSASRQIPEHQKHLIVDLEGVDSANEILETITGTMPRTGHAIVMVGNIHGHGEKLLHVLEAAQLAAEVDAAITTIIPSLADIQYPDGDPVLPRS